MQPHQAICATVLAATFIPPLGPACASPVLLPEVPTAQSDVVQVQEGARWRRNFRRGNGHGWHNGFRGYRHHHRGYREYNGFWFPGGAFAAGVIIGSAIADGNRYYGPYDGYDSHSRAYHPDRYYGERYYGGYYRDAYPCTPRLEDAGKCGRASSDYYGNYPRRVIIIDR